MICENILSSLPNEEVDEIDATSVEGNSDVNDARTHRLLWPGGYNLPLRRDQVSGVNHPQISLAKNKSR